MSLQGSLHSPPCLFIGTGSLLFGTHHTKPPDPTCRGRAYAWGACYAGLKTPSGRDPGLCGDGLSL